MFIQSIRNLFSLVELEGVVIDAVALTFRSENPHEGENTRQHNFSGAGGSRTLVQTGKPYAFYMLILAFIVGL